MYLSFARYRIIFYNLFDVVPKRIHMTAQAKQVVTNRCRMLSMKSLPVCKWKLKIVVVPHQKTFLSLYPQFLKQILPQKNFVVATTIGRPLNSKLLEYLLLIFFRNQCISLWLYLVREKEISTEIYLKFVSTYQLLV